MASNEADHIRNEETEKDLDPIWLSSRTARQIYALGEVEKVRVKYRAVLLRLS